MTKTVFGETTYVLNERAFNDYMDALKQEEEDLEYEMDLYFEKLAREIETDENW